MTDEELIQKAQGYFKDLKILNVVRNTKYKCLLQMKDKNKQWFHLEI